jgi:hypothetical protein
MIGRLNVRQKGVIEMRRLSLALAALFVLFVSATQAQAQTFTWTADLHGGNEVPGVVSGAGGTATITVNMTTNVLTYQIDVYNLATGVTASHIHAGNPGVGGPVVINFTVVPNTSNDFRISGTVNLSEFVARPAQGINSIDDVKQMLLNEDGYVNVHSGANPGGEIRGQIVLQKQ